MTGIKPSRPAISTENWSRLGEEVNFLMTLFERVLQAELQALEAEQVRIRFLGDLKALPQKLQELIADATARTAGNNGIRLPASAPTTAADGSCLPLGGWPGALLPELDPDSIDENNIAAELFTAGEQDPDLLIRTSGEHRINNFCFGTGLRRDSHHRCALMTSIPMH